MMHVGDAPGDGILNRDHRKLGRAVAHGGKSILESEAWHRLVIRKHRVAGEIGIGALRALECDFVFHPSPKIPRAFSKSSGVSTPSGMASITAASMCRPSASARNCSSFSRNS